MFAYIILFTILLMASFIRKKSFTLGIHPSRLNGNDVYMYFGLFVLLLLMGLRSPSVGCDLIRYMYRYENADFFYKLGFSNTEWGFNGLSYFFHDILGWSFQSFIFFISATCILAIGFILKRYTIDPFIGIVIYVTVGNFSINMSGLRQTIAISLVLFAMYYIENRKPLKYLLMIFIASIFHNSALVFLPFYLLWGRRINKKSGLLLLLIVIGAFFYRNLLNGVISIMAPSKYRSIDLNQGSYINILVILVPIVFTLFALMYLPRLCDGKYDTKHSFFLFMSLLNIFFLIISLNNNQLGRLSYYVTFGNMVLMGDALRNVSSKNVTNGFIIKSCMISLCLAWFFISVPGGTLQIDNYHFFWQT